MQDNSCGFLLDPVQAQHSHGRSEFQREVELHIDADVQGIFMLLFAVGPNASDVGK